MFVDEVKVELTAGKGGNGIVAYRRELKIEKVGLMEVMVVLVVPLFL